ncbi:MAG: sulfite exporter TauE/SafE family protein [Oscillospiraceae bacterium]|nr:sulfite exporter TauE/SafE family protein [Oscillospiraceae bacterium]
MRQKRRYILAGAAAGLANGFFGGGGGSVLVPILTRCCGMKQRQAFATAVAVILPLCVFSVCIYFARGGLSVGTAWPYVLGGAVGGWLGGRIFGGVRVDWLRRGFGVLLILSGLRTLL